MRILPPLSPPRRPRATAAGSFSRAPSVSSSVRRSAALAGCRYRSMVLPFTAPRSWGNSRLPARRTVGVSSAAARRSTPTLALMTSVPGLPKWSCVANTGWTDDQSCKRLMPFVYLLRCSDGSLYTGAAKDLARRLAEHTADRASRYTRSRLPVALVVTPRAELERRAPERAADQGAAPGRERRPYYRCTYLAHDQPRMVRCPSRSFDGRAVGTTQGVRTAPPLSGGAGSPSSVRSEFNGVLQALLPI
jgi:predicted GIY-YIG superfamily endonuclease